MFMEVKEEDAPSKPRGPAQRGDVILTSSTPPEKLFDDFVRALQGLVPAHVTHTDARGLAVVATCFENYCPVHIEVHVDCHADLPGSQASLRHSSRADVVRFHSVCNSIVAALRADGVDISGGLHQRPWVVEPLDDLLDEEDEEEEVEWIRDAAQQALLGCPESLQLLAARTSTSPRLCAIAAESLSEAGLLGLLRGPVEELYPAAALLKHVATCPTGSGTLASWALRDRVQKVIWGTVVGNACPCPQLVVRELLVVLAAMPTAANVASPADYGTHISYGRNGACGGADRASFASTCVSDVSGSGEGGSFETEGGTSFLLRGGSTEGGEGGSFDMVGDAGFFLRGGYAAGGDGSNVDLSACEWFRHSFDGAGEKTTEELRPDLRELGFLTKAFLEQ